MSEEEKVQDSNESKVQEQEQAQNSFFSLDDVIESTDKASKLSLEERGEIDKGLKELQKWLSASKQSIQKVDKFIIDEMVAEIDQELSLQMDEILQDKDFKKLESAWRSLKFLVDRTNFEENIEIEILNVTKEELKADFEDNSEITETALYKQIYLSDLGTYGGEPYGSIISNYEFGPGSGDINFLSNISKISARSHAPFFGAASPEMLGVEKFSELPSKQFDFETNVKYKRWRSFREEENSRYIGLVLPRFLLRIPYGKDPGQPDNEERVKTFKYQEKVLDTPENYLWGNAVYAFASRLTESFANYRLCVNIIGPESGGTVEQLPMSYYETGGSICSKDPVEVKISDGRELELANEGFIPLVMNKSNDYATFFSANSVQKPLKFPEKQATIDYKISTEFPYLFIASRLSHYLKIILRQKIGSYSDKNKLKSELEKWIKPFVYPDPDPQPAVLSRKPLKEAIIDIEDMVDEKDGVEMPGWYVADLKITPHYKFMGMYVQISLVGKKD